ncbi:MAG: TM0106 family RecB-like putative nuclease [Elusimicrobiaceae bacterium]|nr:TM0106 family RecB-like putative nuclease [Elusimicrobiaceae bacterium]
MTDLELSQLYTEFSDGRVPNEQDFNAGRMFTLLEDPFCIWCNFHAPQEEAVPETNRYENLKVRTDRHVRDEWIKDQFSRVFFINVQTDADRFTQTLAAMARGEEAIVNAALWNLKEHVYGSANLLVRSNDKSSRFGNYYYSIYQFKRAHDLKEHYALQVSLLSQLLGQIQQVQPANTRVFLKGQFVDVAYADHAERLNQELAFWNNIRLGKARPEAHKPPKAAAAPWRVYANKLMVQTKDLVMLPHLNREMRQCLKINGLFNTDDVAHASLEKLQGILEEPFATETYYNARAYLHNKPIWRKKGCFPPPEKKYNLYFDFEATETFTKDNQAFVYLIGIWDKEEDKYVSFVAKTPEEEINIFEDFYNYIKDFKNTALYHWTEYEVRKMRKLAGAFPDHAAHLNALCDLCFDLKVSVNDAFYLPAPSFSLKAAAPVFGFNWRQDDCGAMDSMVYFTNWLKTGDQHLLDKILMYNEDDCKGMLVLENALKQAEVLDPEGL